MRLKAVNNNELKTLQKFAMKEKNNVPNYDEVLLIRLMFSPFFNGVLQSLLCFTV